MIEFLTIHKASVLLGEYLHDSWPLLPIAREAGVRFFVHAHGYDLSRIFRHEAWRERYRDYAAADGVIVVNSVMRQRMESLGIPAQKIHYIPYGIDIPAAPGTKSDTGVMRCLAVGRMVGKKAPLSLLEAFSRAVAENPRIHLDYVGEGPLYEAATAFVSSRGLGDHVTFHGGQGHDAVMKLMEQADCFVQHSVVDPESGDEEGLPVAILEAMSMALPVISTRHAGIPDAVQHGLNGLLVDEGDVGGMAKHMVELSHNATKRREMGLTGWERARSEFSWPRERDSLRELLGL